MRDSSFFSTDISRVKNLFFKYSFYDVWKIVFVKKCAKYIERNPRKYESAAFLIIFLKLNIGGLQCAVQLCYKGDQCKQICIIHVHKYTVP